MTAKLIIPYSYRYTSKQTDWWSNFFFACGDWREVDRTLIRDWNARVYTSPIAGEVGTIIFENEQDVTMFLLRWS
jgi:hypothetical protein